MPSRPMPEPPPQDDCRLIVREEEEREMFSYSTPEFMDAEVRYRRERVAQDWAARRGFQETAPAPAWRARFPLGTIASLRATPRHHRHA